MSNLHCDVDALTFVLPDQSSYGAAPVGLELALWSRIVVFTVDRTVLCGWIKSFMNFFHPNAFVLVFLVSRIAELTKAHLLGYSSTTKWRHGKEMTRQMIVE